MKKTIQKSLLIVLYMMFMFSCNNPETIITAGCAVANQQCPLDMGDGLTMTKVEFSGSYITYHIKGDYRYSFSQDMRDLVKPEIISDLRQQAMFSQEMADLIKNMKKARVGYIYHYYTADGSVMDVVIEYNEL